MKKSLEGHPSTRAGWWVIRQASEQDLVRNPLNEAGLVGSGSSSNWWGGYDVKAKKSLEAEGEWDLGWGMQAGLDIGKGIKGSAQVQPGVNGEEWHCVESTWREE